MACKGLQPCVISGGMEERWRDGGEENPVEDEFACAGALRGALLSLHPSVKRVFGVTMEIGAEEDAGMPHSGQIWLKLRGRRKDVTASKLFVRGIVNQEEQQEVPYPGVLHCVFCGARGLFLDSLMRNTSAHLVVGSPGFLLISGLTEPVVKAYSLITDLVERYEGTQGRRVDGGERGSGESLDSRRAFKSLVEIWEDRHTLDLLVLPGAVKETLLDLVRESGLGVDPVVVGVPEERAVLRDTEHPRGLWETQEAFRFRNHLDQRPLPRAGDPRTQELSTRLPESSERDVENALRPSPFSAGAGGGEGGGEGATVGLGGDGPPLNRLFRSFAVRERAEEEEEEEEGGRGRRMRSPQEVGEEEHRSDEEEGERLMSAGSRKELGLLLKFFTTMGYAERVVRRVVSRTGPREASEILDLVQQEQDRSDRQARVRNRPSETEHQEDRGRGGAGGARRGAEGEAEEVGSLVEMPDSEQGRRRRGDRAGREPNMGEVRPLEGPQGRGEEGVNGDDFVLGVLTKAAVSCGYTEEKVVEVYGSLPELSTHQLLLQLQRGGATEAGGTTERGREGPREVDESVLEVQRPGDSRKGRVGEVEGNRAGETPNLSASSGAGEGGLRRNVSRQTHVEEGGGEGRGLSAAVSLTQSDQAQRNVSNRLTTLPPQSNQDPPPFHNSPKRVRGPPQSAYPPTLLFPPASPPKHGPRPTYPLPQPPKPPYLPPQPAGPLPPIQTPNSSTTSHPTARDQRVLPAMPSGAVVTGEQRFLEGLQTTFDLQLTVDPGDPGLRMIIIDGSNVAMSHGLGKFFSCRGIALAVQHFWNRGHRQITTFVPQWRSKRDPRVKEQHYLTELQNLGLLSYTPSREVLGKRINSYDDRFMLQLAHKTEGVIVTNDNLRDLLDESHVWTDIIKKRLLQYTFVGDHFMVPDDPLGRGGPHLDHFLHSQHSIPTPGSHSFAGSASSPPRPSRHPRPHTEGLQFRDRTPGVPTGQDFSFGPGQGRRGGQGRGQGPRAERSPADTARLREGLSQVFPDQDSRVILVLQSNPTLTDINSLSHLILEQEEELE